MKKNTFDFPAKVKEVSPLIHCMTNYVTVNDVANVLLALGASPVMADCIKEVEQISSVSKSLYINIGTLNKMTVKSMLTAGKNCNKKNIPVVFDPVGCGASDYRKKTSLDFISRIQFACIRGNASEIKTLSNKKGFSKGVDATSEDSIKKNNIDELIENAKHLALETNSTVVISGKKDIVSNGTKTVVISAGCEMMKKITGSGCMLSAVISAFIASVWENENPEIVFDSIVYAVSAFGIAGEKAFARMKKNDGNSSFRNYLIDEIYNLNHKTIYKESKIEYR